MTDAKFGLENNNNNHKCEIHIKTRVKIVERLHYTWLLYTHIYGSATPKKSLKEATGDCK